MLTCTRKLQFCAGHRVLGHEGKCSAPHGHQYEVEIEARADKLDSIGRIIDFSVLKKEIGGWIDEFWDHGFLVAHNDDELYESLSRVKLSKIFVCPFNPTAENIAKYLLERTCPTQLEGLGVLVTSVTVHETPNCYAKASLESNITETASQIIDTSAAWRRHYAKCITYLDSKVREVNAELHEQFEASERAAITGGSQIGLALQIASATKAIWESRVDKSLEAIAKQIKLCVEQGGIYLPITWVERDTVFDVKTTIARQYTEEANS